jgi:hypothetical protein
VPLGTLAVARPIAAVFPLSVPSEAVLPGDTLTGAALAAVAGLEVADALDVADGMKVGPVVNGIDAAPEPLPPPPPPHAANRLARTNSHTHLALNVCLG